MTREELIDGAIIALLPEALKVSRKNPKADNDFADAARIAILWAVELADVRHQMLLNGQLDYGEAY